MRPLAVSMGCPSGVGPEVAIAACDGANDAVIYGDFGVLRARARCVGVDPARLVAVPSIDARAEGDYAVRVVQVGPPLRDVEPGRPSRAGGEAQLAYVEAACDAVVAGKALALVTAPVSKEAIAHAHDGADWRGRNFLGHTEWLGERLGGVETVMAFYAPALTISLVTTHLPIERVASAITIDAVARAAYWTARLADDLEIRGDVVVLALNPHAGEKGLLGRDEIERISPGISRARERLANEGRARSIVGPLPAESAIRRAVHEKAYAACVAMYHDQATIPSKLVAFGDAVNVTLGLPIVRTSVDHGTAYDLAGTGKADAAGMKAALSLARILAAKSRSSVAPVDASTRAAR